MTNRFVEKLKSFADLGEADVAALVAATAAPRAYTAKQDLIREGDQPGPVFVVLGGWACRYKILPSGTRQITAFLMPGDCCDLNIGMLAEWITASRRSPRPRSPPSHVERWTP